jgi:hypothetical protein
MRVHMYRAETVVSTFTAPLLARRSRLPTARVRLGLCTCVSCTSILAAGFVFMGGIMSMKVDASVFSSKITE